MKNFKRVISAVIAMALSASTLVAVNAAKYTDVADTAPYAEAINVLSSLGVLHGYEDGSFNPEGDITRAEAVTMIVGGVNLTAEAQAAAGSSKFTDVNEQASWASGYVNVGVAQGFINGMDETHFAPQDKVTYAQMCVMLTLITGYGDYAKEAGGWPTGYVTMANQAKISEGVILENNTTLKRGQVARMLYNAIKICKLGIVEYTFNGNTYAPLNGSEKAGNRFSTILHDEFDGYILKANIKETAKSTDGTVDAGKARIKIESADWWNDAIVGTEEAEKLDLVTVILDDITVDEYLYQSGTAVVTIDNLDQAHLIYFAPNTKVDTKIVKAEDYEEPEYKDGENVNKAAKTIADDKKITFGTKDYKVDEGTLIVLNGYEYKYASDAELINIMRYAHGDVTLIDNLAGHEGYDKMLVNAYDTGKVSSVTTAKDVVTITVTKVKGINSNVQTIKIDKGEVEDGNVVLTCKDSEGNDIDLESLKKDDVISFAIKAQNGSKVENPMYIDIVSTDEIISGKVTLIDSTDKNYTVDGTEYEMTEWKDDLMKVGETYEIVLDPFGRIFDADLTLTSAKYAIVEKYDEDYGWQLVLPNGSYKYYETASGMNYFKDGGASTLGAVKTIVETNKANPAKRVAKYTVKNSTGEITSLDIVGTDADQDQEYKARTGKLGSYTIIDSTQVIDASAYVTGDNKVSEYAGFAVSSFSDKTKYDCVAFKAPGASGSNAAFVVLTKIGTVISDSSRFAVVRKDPAKAQTDDGDACWKVNALFEGVEQDLLFTDSANGPTLKQGDAFFFKTDSDGLVDGYYRVFEFAKYANGEDGKDPFAAFIKFKALAQMGKMTYDESDWSFDLYNNDANIDCQLVYGIVTDVTNRGIEFAVADGNGDINRNKDIKAAGQDGVISFGIDGDCVAYKYGLSENSSKRAYDSIYAIEASGIAASDFDSYEDDNVSDLYHLDTVLGGDTGWDRATYALAMLVDGDIVAIYAINQ